MNTRLIILRVAVLALLALAVSCQSKKGRNIESTEEFATNNVEWCDSIHEGAYGAICTIRVDYPQSGNDHLVDGIRSWIASELGVTDENTFDSSIEMLSHAGRQMLSQAENDFSTFDTSDEDFGINYDYDVDIKKIWESDSVVTFLCTKYEYLGGAHGSTTTEGRTFTLSDGHTLGYNIFIPSDTMQLRHLLGHRLRQQYVSANQADVIEGLFVDLDTVPLPSTEPYMTANGMNFIWQQYEIGPYAIGMPSCTLKYDEIAPMVLDQYRNLLP